MAATRGYPCGTRDIGMKRILGLMVPVGLVFTVGCVPEPAGDCSIFEQSCDDTNPEVNPGQVEVCDLEDNDCNGLADETFPKVPWYPDEGGDGFGAADRGQSYCRSPGEGFTQVPGDCDDDDTGINRSHRHPSRRSHRTSSAWTASRRTT